MAQWRLLITALAGRRWHCGSRPMMNCGRLTGTACPFDLPAVMTTKLSFIADLDPWRGQYERLFYGHPHRQGNQKQAGIGKWIRGRRAPLAHFAEPPLLP